MELNAQTLNRFQTQHTIVKHYIDDLPPEAIYTRLNPKKWSIHETIAYVCRYHYIFMNRLDRIINEINPFFEMYKVDNDVEYNFTAAKTSGSLLHEIYRIRDDIKIMLEELDINQYSRIGAHAVLGKMNINQWVEFFLLHESNQLYKIFKLAGSFWSLKNQQSGNVVNLPHLQSHIDDLAG